LKPDTEALRLYGTELIEERHRHRYEINNEYREILETNGLKISGLSPDGMLVEMVEITDHPWYVACQFHPELKSRPNRPHPLFLGLVEHALEYQDSK
jgi:CTP synthase